MEHNHGVFKDDSPLQINRTCLGSMSIFRGVYRLTQKEIQVPVTTTRAESNPCISETWNNDDAINKKILEPWIMDPKNGGDEPNNCQWLHNITSSFWIQSFSHQQNRMIQNHHEGVSKNRGTPKWMVYNGKPYEQMDDLGVPLFTETPMMAAIKQKQTKDQILACQTNPFQQPWVSGTLHSIPTWEGVKQRWVQPVLGSRFYGVFFLDPHPRRIIWATKNKRPYFRLYWFFNRDPYNGSTTIPT